MESLAPEITAAWTGLMRAAASVQGAVEAALKAEGLPPLGWYDVLWEIEQAGEVRPFELEPRLLLPQYALSRLVERLVRAGLVARGAVEGDGRGQVLSLTGEGRAMRTRIWPVYAGALRSALGERLTLAEAADLARLLRKLR
jgi:DNA-binding MarR family transcriptional regulator